MELLDYKQGKILNPHLRAYRLPYA